MQRFTFAGVALVLLPLLSACKDTVAPRLEARGGTMLDARPPGQSLTSWPVSQTAIALSWVDDARREVGWEIHRSSTGANGAFATVGSVGANVTWFSDAGLTLVTEYCYRVRSFRMTGPKPAFDGFSNVSCSTTFGPSPAPSNVNATPQGLSVSVTWVDNATTESGYRVERAPDAKGEWVLASNVSPNATAYVDFGRTAEQLVCYRVITVDPYGESVSTTSTFDCTTPADAPTAFVAQPTDPNVIDLIWQDNSGFEDFYEVARSNSVGGFDVVATLPRDATTYHDAGLQSDRGYTHRVRALTDGGYSDPTYVSSLLLSGPPAPPSVDAIPYGSTYVVLYTYSQSVGVDVIRIERSFDRATWESVAESAPGEGSSDGSLTPEREVCYRGIARNRLGESVPSAMDCTTPPAAPSDVRMTTADAGFDFTWKDNSAVEDGYGIFEVIHYDDGYVQVWLIAITDPDATSYTLPYESYSGREYLVAALKDGGQSDFGAWAQASAAGNATSMSAARAAPRTIQKLVVREGKPPRLPPQRSRIDGRR